MNKEDAVLMQYLPKEVHSVDRKNYLEIEFDFENATRQWFNTLTGAYTEKFYDMKKDLNGWAFVILSYRINIAIMDYTIYFYGDFFKAGIINLGNG